MLQRQSVWAAATSAEPVPAHELKHFAVWALVVFWLGFVVLYSVRSALIGANPVDNLVPRVLVAIYGAALSWLMFICLEKLRPKSVAGAMLRALSVAVIVSIIFATGHQLIFTPLAKVQGAACASFAWERCPQPNTWTAIVDNAVNWTFLFSAWGLVQLAGRSTLERWAADNRAGEQREAARVAEIRALRYQVNPHFLFNCLNSLATLVRRPDRGEAEEMIEELGAFLRYGLASDLLTDVDLRDEVEMQERYLILECRRFAHRLAVRIDVAKDVERARVPSLILQPLVENAVSHGVAKSADRTVITIRAFQNADGRLTILVEDDAMVERDKVEPTGSSAGFGIGLRNVCDRLAARFGSDASCRTTRLPLRGFRSAIEMPLVNTASPGGEVATEMAGREGVFEKAPKRTLQVSQREGGVAYSA